MTRLSVRLLASHVAVAVAGGAVSYLVVRLLAPRLFDADGRVGGEPGRGSGAGAGLRDAFASAVDTSLLAGLAAGLTTGVLLAVLLSGRVLGPLHRVREATHRISAGDYESAVPLPSQPELAGLARDVNMLGERLRDVEQRRLRLLADVAHEMRTPLTVLGGYVDGLGEGIFDLGPEMLTDLRFELERLERLADDLSTLSRTEEGRLALHLGTADVTALVDDAARRLAPSFRELQVELEARHDVRPLPGYVDAARIDQVLSNLLRNARAATPSGGRVTIATSTDDDAIVIRVSDTGVGLAPEEIPRVFERFYRVPGPRPSGRGDRPGSGIGLTVSRGLVRAQGGTLEASSPGVGRGATFTVRLPLRGTTD